MKSSIKTLAVWLIIGIIFIVLLTSIMENSGTRMSYSELLVYIDQERVAEIELASGGDRAYVTLRNETTQRQVNIPSLNSFVDRVNDHLAEGSFTLEERSESMFLVILRLLSPFGLIIIFFIFWLLFMNNAQGRRRR